MALLAIAGLAGSVGVTAQSPSKKPAAKPAPKHIVVNVADMTWGPAPPGLPPGGQIAVIDGDPSKAGVPFTMRAKFPDGYTVPPHWHPGDEHVVVISGALKLGMGDKMDEATMTTLTPGGYAKMPKLMHHSAKAKGDTTIQVSGIGPFGITYVNPNDDPTKKK